MAIWCRCPCHAHLVGDLHDAQQRGDLAAVAYFSTDDHLCLPPLVAVTDPLEILVALGCGCGKYHASLPMPRPPYKPPTKWHPSDDE